MGNSLSETFNRNPKHERKGCTMKATLKDGTVITLTNGKRKRDRSASRLARERRANDPSIGKATNVGNPRDNG